MYLKRFTFAWLSRRMELFGCCCCCGMGWNHQCSDAILFFDQVVAIFICAAVVFISPFGLLCDCWFAVCYWTVHVSCLVCDYKMRTKCMTELRNGQLAEWRINCPKVKILQWNWYHCLFIAHKAHFCCFIHSFIHCSWWNPMSCWECRASQPAR